MRKASAGFLPFWAELDINSVREAESEILKKVGIRGEERVYLPSSSFSKIEGKCINVEQPSSKSWLSHKIRVCAKILPLGNLLPKLSDNRSG